MSGRDNDATDLTRYARQTAFGPLGLEGQRALVSGTVLIVGAGGLGSRTAELLARAGVGRLRLVDDDKVDLTNIHRQTLYDQADARVSRSKAKAAAAHLKRINSTVNVEPIVARIGKDNIEALIEGVNVILDGTDNFAARFLINDASVKFHRPWVFAGVVGAEGQTMTVVPGRTPCLRCILEPTPSSPEPTSRSFGVLGPAVAAIASFQAGEAMKIIAGKEAEISPYLMKFDLWANTMQRIDVRTSRAPNCPCCGQRIFQFLTTEGPR